MLQRDIDMGDVSVCLSVCPSHDNESKLITYDHAVYNIGYSTDSYFTYFSDTVLGLLFGISDTVNDFILSQNRSDL